MRRKSRRSRLILSAIIIPVVLGILYKSQSGSRHTGIVASVAELPEVGELLPDFKVTSKMKYVHLRRYTRPISSVLFTGVTTSESVREFFGRQVHSADERSYSAWGNILQSMGVGPNEFPVGSSAEDLQAYREMRTSDHVLVIRMTFLREDGRFTAHVVRSPRGSGGQ